jgi:hypothetical protein
MHLRKNNPKEEAICTGRKLCGMGVFGLALTSTCWLDFS